MFSKEILDIIKIVINIYTYVTPKKKLYVNLIILLVVISSLTEVFSIGILLPFITLIISPEYIFDLKFANIDFSKMNLEKYNLEFIFSIIFIFAIIVSNSLRILVLYLVSLISKMIVADFARKIYSNSINQSFNTIISKNSNELVSVITEKLEILSSVISNFFLMISSTIIGIGIVTFLFFLNFKIALSTTLFILIFYFVIYSVVQKKLLNISVESAKLSFLKIKLVRESYNGIRQVILSQAQNFYTDNFFNLERSFRKKRGVLDFLQSFPRFMIEALGVIVIISLIYYSIKTLKTDPLSMVPILGVFVFSAQRLLPVMQNIYVAFVGTRGNLDSLIEIQNLLNQQDIETLNLNKSKSFTDSHLNFEKEITLRDVSFSYTKFLKPIINNLNVNIKKNSKTVIIGSTGSGKSTFLDIIMYLQRPSEGKILIDNIELNEVNYYEWLKNISHVPQEIFLFDTTIRENISFTKNDVDEELIIKSSKSSEIHKFIKSLPNGYDTIVGENGAYLSGGQKQRIGIARALYQNRKILILDEATSALDSDTEKKILDNLYLKKDLTIIQVTHRKVTNKNFDQIIRL
jgi:ATP-binding cassette, subfamily B, bacterial PglK